jgi:cytochrome c oxidase subunit 3
MVSMTMMFAGLTSAFVVSKSRVDWLTDFELPTPFYYSTIVIIGCSITFHLEETKKTIKAPLLHFCYFSIGDIVCDPAVYGFGQIARWVLFHGK